MTGPAVRAVDSSASTFVDPPGFDFKDLRADTRYALSAFARSHSGAVPESAVQLVPYFKPPLSEARRERFLQNGVPATP